MAKVISKQVPNNVFSTSGSIALAPFLLLLAPTLGYSNYYNLGGFFRPSGCPGVSYVRQSISANILGSTSGSTTITPTTGDMVLATVFANNFPNPGGPPVTYTVSDSLGNTWNAVAPVNDTLMSYGAQFWFASNVTGGSSDTVTLTINGANYPNMYLAVLEYKGLATSNMIDKSSEQ